MGGRERGRLAWQKREGLGGRTQRYAAAWVLLLLHPVRCLCITPRMVCGSPHASRFKERRSETGLFIQIVMYTFSAQVLMALGNGFLFTLLLLFFPAYIISGKVSVSAVVPCSIVCVTVLEVDQQYKPMSVLLKFLYSECNSDSFQWL